MNKLAEGQVKHAYTPRQIIARSFASRRTDENWRKTLARVLENLRKLI